MVRISVLLAWLSIAGAAHAQPRPCASIPGPTLVAMPDEPPSLHAPPDTLVARAATIEAMALGDPARPAAMAELAEAYRALGRIGDEERTLARIVQDHPSAAILDHVQYRLARALEGDGRMDQARVVWMHIVRSFPTSPYVVAAYVSFGDYYVLNDDLDIAHQFFDHALMLAASPWSAYARYRFAWTLARQHDASALEQFRLAVTALDASPQLGAPLVRAALAADQGSLSATLSCRP